ncbi:hypothetical protein BJV82DRAFT_576871 [Fennellomyces sp. T-0311]|nr:hypothetical protein BJV82DRAFT_576871 [Fennellomyces sp. T-0311]
MDFHSLDFDDGIGHFQTMTTTPRTFPLAEATDVRGQRVDVRQLASDYLLVLITLKRADCPVCPQLLKMLNLYGLEPDANKYVDPFTQREWDIEPDRKKFFRLLLKRDAYFIVICPGSEEAVAQIQQDTPFMQYPFIGGEQAMSLGHSLKLNMSDTELWPAMLEVEPNNLAASLISFGRGPGEYDQNRLFKKLFIERCHMEIRGMEAMAEARSLIEQTKRRIVKCRDKKLAGYNLSLLPRQPPPQPPKEEEPSNESRPFHDVLPPEILDIVLSFTPDTRSLVKLARTSRLFYMTSCNVIIQRLKDKTLLVQNALPKKDGQVLEIEDEALSIGLNRWHDDSEGVGYRDLERRVVALKAINTDVTKWTRQWSRRTPPRQFNAPIEKEPALFL